MSMAVASFELPDPYEGWSVDQLKEHCRKLVSANMRYQNIILNLSDGGMPSLNDAGRAEVARLREAYSDDCSETR